MIAAIGSEWVKLRSVRSTLLAFLVAALTGALTIWLTGNAASAWDDSSPELRAAPSSAAGSFPWIGDTTFTLAYLALAVTGTLAASAEYATGTIGASLLGTPRRIRLLAAKAATVAAYSSVVGVLVMAPSALASHAIVSDRELGPPYVIGDRFHDAATWAAASVPVAAVAGLVGLGVGLALRSTAMAVTVSAGLLVVPGMVAMTLPLSSATKLTGVLLPNLTAQLADTPHSVGVLSPPQAASVMVAYLVTALGAGGLVFLRKDGAR